MAKAQVDATLLIIKEALQNYSLDEIFLSFNGGKDCTVLLDILVKYLHSIGADHKRILYIYVQPEHPFEEIEEFVTTCEQHYDITMQVYRGKLKSTLEKVCAAAPQLKACILGSRRTDPYCEKMQAFQETDHGWPKLMRISPLLEWNCDNVWDYLLENKVAYCKLYDRGYTSIGDKTNTIPNPHLRYEDEKTGVVRYKAAYELRNGDAFERAGRLT
ncbi:FAD synthase-like [Culicoides brevitarsis]|uniref:FAD synthase-like n=1 Tax=Culicoides brevitarsis TaxID=469753 RepID=UPI00307BFCE0